MTNILSHICSCVLCSRSRECLIHAWKTRHHNPSPTSISKHTKLLSLQRLTIVLDPNAECFLAALVRRRADPHPESQSHLSMVSWPEATASPCYTLTFLLGPALPRDSQSHIFGPFKRVLKVALNFPVDGDGPHCTLFCAQMKLCIPYSKIPVQVHLKRSIFFHLEIILSAWNISDF